MRPIWITRPGPPEVLAVREAEDPVAGAGRARIRVRAAGINFADLVARLGLFVDAPKIPCVVGYEAAGTIDQVGPGGAGLAVGDCRGQIRPHVDRTFRFDEAAAAHHYLHDRRPIGKLVLVP